jgi:hypothetical protein
MIHLICNKYAQRSGRITFSVPKASSVRHWDLAETEETDGVRPAGQNVEGIKYVPDFEPI